MHPLEVAAWLPNPNPNPTPNPNPSPTPTPKPTNTRGAQSGRGAEFGTTTERRAALDHTTPLYTALGDTVKKVVEFAAESLTSQ